MQVFFKITIFGGKAFQLYMKSKLIFHFHFKFIFFQMTARLSWFKKVYRYINNCFTISMKLGFFGKVLWKKTCSASYHYRIYMYKYWYIVVIVNQILYLHNLKKNLVVLLRLWENIGFSCYSNMFIKNFVLQYIFFNISLLANAWARKLGAIV